MSGVIFYDEQDYPVVLKSSIPPYGVINIARLDSKMIDIINTVLDLDLSPEEFLKVVKNDENLMRRISKLFWYSTKSRSKRTVYRNLIEYSEFVESIENLCEPIWFPGERSFWIYPPSYIKRARSALKSLVALWLNLDGIETGGMDIIPTTDNDTVKVFHDRKNKVVYTLFKTRGTGESVCLKVDTSKIFARTFIVKYEESVYYTAALRYADPVNLSVHLLRYPEWSVDKAYSALFEDNINKPESSVTVKLKIE